MWFFTDREKAEKKIKEIEKSKSTSNLIRLEKPSDGDQVVKAVEEKLRKEPKKSWF